MYGTISFRSLQLHNLLWKTFKSPKSLHSSYMTFKKVQRFESFFTMRANFDPAMCLRVHIQISFAFVCFIASFAFECKSLWVTDHMVRQTPLMAKTLIANATGKLWVFMLFCMLSQCSFYLVVLLTVLKSTLIGTCE